MDGRSELQDGSWLGTLRPAVTLLVAFTVATVGYTVFLAGAARVMGRATSTDVVLDAARAASWSGPEWFHGRPTAAVAGVSGGSNLGPTNPALAAAVAARVAAVRSENPAHDGPIPVDLVTASGSGLDPHISPPAARLQVPRVAAASGIPAGEVLALVERSIEPPVFGLFGPPRVNVVRLNAALRALATDGRRGSPPAAP